MLDPRSSGSLQLDIDRQLRIWRTLAPKAVNEGLYAGIWAAVLDVQSHAKKLIQGPVLNRRTGRLWRSIHSEVYRRHGTVVGIVGTDVKYAPVHEFGATIRPKKAGGRLFFKDADGGFVSVREVKIPRRPYMSRALTERSARAKELINAYVMEAVKRSMKLGKSVPAGSRAGSTRYATKESMTYADKS